MEPAQAQISEATTFGNIKSGKFWVEYPSGLVDITANHPPLTTSSSEARPTAVEAVPGSEEPPLHPTEIEFDVQEDRRVRLDMTKSALVMIDMQKCVHCLSSSSESFHRSFFLHPGLRSHPLGLACVQPLVDLVPFLRAKGIKIVWCNWGLTDAELLSIPPSLARSFSKGNSLGFGSELPGGFGRLLMRDEKNSELYGPLQELYEQGRDADTDVWVHKNRMSGIWGGQSELDLYLQSKGYDTLMFGGVNADQCVLGTVIDAYYKGYNCILVEDCTATTSPEGGQANVVYNCAKSYGFVVDHDQIMRG